MQKPDGMSWEDLAAHYEAESREAARRRAESWERSDTDGFVSQWASGLTDSQNRMNAEICRAGGMAAFDVLMEGDRIISRRRMTFQNRHSYGWESKWLVEDEADQLRLGRKWIPTGKRSRIQKTLGLHEGEEWAPAHAILWSPPGSTGIGGSVFVRAARDQEDQD